MPLVQADSLDGLRHYVSPENAAFLIARMLDATHDDLLEADIEAKQEGATVRLTLYGDTWREHQRPAIFSVQIYTVATGQCVNVSGHRWSETRCMHCGEPKPGLQSHE